MKGIYSTKNFVLVLSLIATIAIILVSIPPVYAASNTITFTSNPSGSGFITVAGTPVTTSTTASLNQGDTRLLVANTPVLGSAGTQYVFTSWTISGGAGRGSLSSTTATTTIYTAGTKTCTVTANYQTQYYLTVNDGGHGSAGGAGWKNAGSSATATMSSLTVAGTTGTQYVFAGWTADASGAGSPSDLITMSGPKTATATWTTQYQVTFSQTGIDSSAGTNTVVNVGGTNYAYNTLPSNTYFDSGTTFTWAPTVLAGSNKEFFKNGGSGSSPITAAGAYSATYLTGYRVTFTAPTLSGVASATKVLTMGTTDVTFNDLPFENILLTDGTTYSYVETLDSTTSGMQFVLTGTSPASPISGSTGATITGTYELTNIQQSTTLTVKSNPETIPTTGGAITITATLKSGTDPLVGDPLSGKSVTVVCTLSVGGTLQATELTDANGQIKPAFTVPDGQPPGSFYVITATFDGDSQYLGKTAVTTNSAGGGGLMVVPEYLFGGLAAVGACFVGFAFFKKRSSLPSFGRQ
jgi:uncharacterized repeat protein (TIGR02543 family)